MNEEIKMATINLLPNQMVKINGLPVRIGKEGATATLPLANLALLEEDHDGYFGGAASTPIEAQLETSEIINPSS